MSNPLKPNELVIFLSQQLQILRNIYLRMREVDFGKKIKSQSQGASILTVEEFALDLPKDNVRVRLDYLQFTATLNQLGRVMKDKKYIRTNFSDFPAFYRIRLFRNCIGEHWDQFGGIIGSGFTFSQSKAPIPTFEGSYLLTDRENLKNSLKNEFAKEGIKFNLPKKYSYTGASSSKNYSDYIYKKLEIITKELLSNPRIKSKKIIPIQITNLLFLFGFPAPITDMEGYSESLIRLIYKILKRENVKI